MPNIKFINIYPIKSMQGLSVDSAQIDLTGLKYDRIAMLTKPDGTFITARTHPILLSFKVEIDDQKITIKLSNEHSITAYFSEFETHKNPTQVWNSNFSSYVAPEQVNQFLSAFLNESVQLRWIGKTSDRMVNNLTDVPLSFADGAPYLLLNQASFNYLQEKCPEKLLISQFRGNLIVDNAEPFIEDEWLEIKIGDVLFEVISPCIRCMMTTIDPITQHISEKNEPLKTLSQFRQDENGKIHFGMTLFARNQGTIRINDPITVIKTQPAKIYNKNTAPIDTESNKVTISYEDKQFIGNTQDVLLEQLESAGIPVPYSCRAGICGQCRIHLEDGLVDSKVKSAIKRNGDILACSCIPKSNVKLNPSESN